MKAIVQVTYGSPDVAASQHWPKIGPHCPARSTRKRAVLGTGADNNNFLNQSITLTIWPAEGVSLIVLGKQEGAPVVDVHLDAERR
jgi:hypothetical protein